ncbi:hypothetical protein K440DRAFT_636735 [Wilcoxina mikolae CBS 423.85]|nr:hypothetical protein K440DRAFT_636735 [Wilcoxina mikolae CBS 423.85]
MLHQLTHRHAIASSYRACTLSFDRLFEILEIERHSGDISQNLDPVANEWEQVGCFKLQLDDNLGRFKVWGENCGAHRHGRVSLDYRLREAANVKQMVLELLDNLNSDLKHAIAIISGETQFEQPDEDDESLSDSDSSQSSLEDDDSTAQSEPDADTSTKSRLEECITDITHVITCLYKFSITIQNPAPRDRLEKCSSIPISNFKEFDIQHVSHKFPDAPKYLIERLSKANTKRRQLLKYHEIHHEKIAGNHGLHNDETPRESVSRATAGNDFDGDNRLQGATENTITIQTQRLTPSEGPATIRTRLTQTTVSVYVPRGVNPENVLETDDQSQTSYASSAGGGQANLQVPPPPEQDRAFDGEPFQCPFCFVIISVSGRQSWKRHVFRDLRPYVCTFKGCQKSDHLFDNRHDWFQHELDLHRKEWFCNACDAPDDHQKTYISRQLFQNHLENVHSTQFMPAQIQTVIDRCERPIALEQTCLLCGEKHIPSRLQRHLGGHMQQIALFVARPSWEEQDGDLESVGAQIDGCDSESRSNDSLEFESNPSQHSDNYEKEPMEPEPEDSLSKGNDANTKSEQQDEGSDSTVVTEETMVDQTEFSSLHDAATIDATTDPGEQDEGSDSAVVTEEITMDQVESTSLHDAAEREKGHEATVRLLLEKGTDIEAKAINERTALHFAAMSGHDAIVRLLLNRSANIQAQNSGGSTALDLAIKGEHKSTVQLLRDRLQ